MIRVFSLVFLIPIVATAAEPRKMIIEDLFAFKRIADPQISPDGKWMVYQQSEVNLEANKSNTSLWIQRLEAKSEPRKLTNSGKSDRHPRWSPDGQKILFESNRSGSNQLWVIDLNGGEARQITSIATGAGNGIWSPDGAKIAFVSSVFPEFSDKPYRESNELNRKKLEEMENSPVKARVFTKLFFRHWDEYVEDKRQHLFIIDAAGATDPIDVTPGDRDGNPTSSTFSAGDDFTFTPNSKFLVFTAPPQSDEAWTTNYDLYRVPVSGGKIELLTGANEAADGCPRFSPDGKKLIYRAQSRPKFEADKWDIVVVDTDGDGNFNTTPTKLTSKIDQSVNEIAWGKTKSDEPVIYFTSDSQGATKLFAINLAGNLSKSANEIGSVSSLSFAAGKLVYSRSELGRPADLYLRTTGEPDQANRITTTNDALLQQIDLPRPESISIDVEGGKMQMWILKPPGFDPRKKWPVAYLVHGGPQGAWEDGWSYRWNPQVWAAQGYIVALPNPRGSTGFGQKFVDEISLDWGGKVYDDLMKGVDYLEQLPYVDRNRIGAAGASFGGYMMNWFSVNTGRFRCLITHCSVWNFESMWGTTEELWFDEYEHGGGKPPWENPEGYLKFSPHKKAANLGKFKTPMLIIHNDYDFRCPIGQGHELFNALQRQKVPSRFINFPDEGHWVLKPKNSQRWHREVFDWLTKYVPPGGN